MKFIVAVDLEGISCSYAPYGASIEESFNVAAVRKYATMEANAAATALFDCGADEVIVWDNHGRGCSLNYEDLDERVLIALGSDTALRYPDLDGVDGVLFIGYHAMAGTEDASICHTFSSKTYQWVKVNGKEAGEISIDAMIAGKYDIPVIFVSTDDKAINEVKDVIPWAVTVETKKSLAFTRVISKHPKKTAKEIYDGVCDAYKKLKAGEMKPYKVNEPCELEIRYYRVDYAKDAKNVDMNGESFKLKDAYTREGTLKRVDDIPFRLC